MKNVIKINTTGTVDLTDKVVEHLKDLDNPLATKLIELNGELIKGHIDLEKDFPYDNNFSIFELKGNEAGCYLPFYIEVDEKIILLNLDHMKACTFEINLND